MNLSNKTYDLLKFIALIALPAVATLYLGLGELWDFPNTEAVAGSIVLVDTFLGALLQLSSGKASNIEGYLDSEGVDPDTGLPNLKMTITKPPDEILQSNMIRLKVGAVPEKR